MKMFVILSFCLCIACAAPVNPTPTDHGWSTPYVIATRYSNPKMGWNAGFDFPRNPNDADSMEVLHYFEHHHGLIFQGGGHPGATVYVIFENAGTKEALDRKILELLPGLNRLMRTLSRR